MDKTQDDPNMYYVLLAALSSFHSEILHRTHRPAWEMSRDQVSLQTRSSAGGSSLRTSMGTPNSTKNTWFIVTKGV